MSKCFIGIYAAPFAFNLIRMLLFNGYMSALSKHCSFYFPYPFAWIFKDLSKFVFEPYCIRVFEQYLSAKEPVSRYLFTAELQYYEKIMESYLGRHEDIMGAQAEDPGADFSINHEDVAENIERLTKSFDNFKRTVSCVTIYNHIRQFEEINKRIDR